MRDATFARFIDDYNEFKRMFNQHLVMTDYRDFETSMYVKAIYRVLTKIPLLKIFIAHELKNIMKRERARREMMEAQIKAEKKSRELKNKLKL